MPNMSRPLAFLDPRQPNYGATPDFYQLFAAATNMKDRGHRNYGSSSSEQMNYVRNPDYRSRPGSEYAHSEVGSSSYISVSPPRCDMNGGSGGSPDGSEPVSPRQFDQQSMASTFSFTSQSSSNLLKSKAQYKDYHSAAQEHRRDQSPASVSVVTANGEKADFNSTVKKNNINACEVNKNNEETTVPSTNIITKSMGDLEQQPNPKPDLASDLVAAATTNEPVPMSSSSPSSGPSPPSSSPGVSSDATSPTRVCDAADDSEEIRKPVKKRKRLNNSEEFNGAGCTSLPQPNINPEETERKKIKFREEQRREETSGLSLQESTEGY